MSVKLKLMDLGELEYPRDSLSNLFLLVFIAYYLHFNTALKIGLRIGAVEAVSPQGFCRKSPPFLRGMARGGVKRCTGENMPDFRKYRLCRRAVVRSKGHFGRTDRRD